jgi:ribosomal protein L36
MISKLVVFKFYVAYLKVESMFKKLMLFLAVFSLGLQASVLAENMTVQPSLFNVDMEQHGTFVADDLRSSPLLRAMFNLSVNDINGELVRICVNQAEQCKVVKRDAKVYLVAANGKVEFDNLN